MKIEEARTLALAQHCRLASETLLAPAFATRAGQTVVLSVNSGYE